MHDPNGEFSRDARPLVAGATNRAAVLGILLALMLPAAALRWPSGDPRTLFIDEPLTWDVVRQSTMGDYITWQHHFEHPPLSYLLAEVSMRASGFGREAGVESLRALRLPAFFAGVLCVPAAFVVGLVLGGPRLGLPAAALAAVDPIHVEQARVARMYPLFVLMLLLSAATLAWSLRRWRTARPISPWVWVLAGALLAGQWWSAGIGFATVAGMLLALAGVVGVEGLLRGNRRRAARLASGVLLAVLVAVLATHVGLLTRMKAGLHDFVDVPRTAATRVEMIWRGLESIANAGALASGAVWVIAVAGCVLLARRSRAGVGSALLLACAAAVNVAALFFALRTYHSLSPRYLIALSPVLWLGLATWPVLAQRRWLRIAGGVVLAAMMLTWTWRAARPSDATDPLRGYAGSILSLPPGEPVLYLPGYIALSGEMLGRPGDEALQAWARTVTDANGADPPPFADDPAASRPASILVWQLGTSRADVRDDYVRVLSAVAEAIQAPPVDRASLERAMRPSAPLVVRVTPDGVAPLAPADE